MMYRKLFFFFGDSWFWFSSSIVPKLRIHFCIFIASSLKDCASLFFFFFSAPLNLNSIIKYSTPFPSLLNNLCWKCLLPVISGSCYMSCVVLILPSSPARSHRISMQWNSCRPLYLSNIPGNKFSDTSETV